MEEFGSGLLKSFDFLPIVGIFNGSHSLDARSKVNLFSATISKPVSPQVLLETCVGYLKSHSQNMVCTMKPCAMSNLVL